MTLSCLENARLIYVFSHTAKLGFKLSTYKIVLLLVNFSFTERIVPRCQMFLAVCHLHGVNKSARFWTSVRHLKYCVPIKRPPIKNRTRHNLRRLQNLQAVSIKCLPTLRISVLLTLLQSYAYKKVSYEDGRLNSIGC